MNSSDKLPLQDRPFELDKYGPVFILGCSRSGTTFLSRCLAPVAQLEEFVGVLAPARFMHLIASTKDPVLKENMMLVTRDSFWQSFWRRRLYRHQRLLEVVKGNASAFSLFKKLEIRDAIFCYKEPFLCFAAVDFARHYPHSKFIHIIRDGRDNVDSMNRTYPMALTDEVLKDEHLTASNVSEIGIWRRFEGYSIPWWIEKGDEDRFITSSRHERNFWMWTEMVSRAREVKKEVDSSRYLEVRYEDFVQDPFTVAQDIFDFLGLKINSGVRKQLKKAYSTSIGVNKRNSSTIPLEKMRRDGYTLLQDLGYIY